MPYGYSYKVYRILCQTGLSRQTVFIDKHGCSSVLMLRSHRLEQLVVPHLYALLIVSLVLGLSSRLICSRDICSQSTVRASDSPTLKA